MARPPASEQVQVNFRMPASLKERIEAAARDNNRSTTAEIVATLEEKYPPRTLALADVAMLLNMLADMSEGQSEADYDAFIAEVNEKFAKLASPYTVVPSQDGGVYFYPYATVQKHRPSPSDD